jgi:hypothetical protein
VNIQSPQLLADLYRDLRDRRLLPLLVVLAVGMAVVPMALSESPKATAPRATPTGAVAASKSPLLGQPVQLSDPGLRDYVRRLEGDTAMDPFAPRVQGSGSGQSGSGTNTSVTSGLTQSSSSSGENVPLTAEGKAAAAAAQSGSPSPAGGTPTSQPAGQTTSKGDSEVVFYRIKVRTGQVGGQMKTQDEVGPSSSLPSKSVPALAFVGTTFDSNLNAKRAFFFVSNSVSAISGDGRCTFGDPCQMLALKPGQHADLVWTDGLVYRVKLIDFERHTQSAPPAQPGGGTDSDSGQRSSGSQRDSGSRKAAGQHFTF